MKLSLVNVEDCKKFRTSSARSVLVCLCEIDLQTFYVLNRLSFTAVVEHENAVSEHK